MLKSLMLGLTAAGLMTAASTTAVLASNPAGQSIAYIFSGSGSWTIGMPCGSCLGNSDPMGSFTVELFGNTGNVFFDSEWHNTPVTGTFTGGGSTLTFDPTGLSVIDNPADPGFLSFAQGGSDEALTNSVFKTYDLKHALGLTMGTTSTAAATFNLVGGGTLNFGDDVTLISAQATTGAPESSTWAMLLLGFAGLGFGLSRLPQARSLGGVS